MYNNIANRLPGKSLKYEKLIKQPQMQLQNSGTTSLTSSGNGNGYGNGMGTGNSNGNSNGIQTDALTDADAEANASADMDVDATADCGHFNKQHHFGSSTSNGYGYGYATPPAHNITDRTMLLPPSSTMEQTVGNGFLASGIVTYKAKSNGFNSTSSTTSAGSSTGGGVGGGGCSGTGSSGSSIASCCNLIARRCFGINVRRCVLALFAITVVSIFYYTHYVGTDVFDG